MKQIILLSMTVISILLLQVAASNIAFATNSPDTVKPTITSRGDIYEISTVPAPVSLFISAIDDVDGKVRVVCDKSSQSVFKVGKTTVRCMATDSAGNMARESFVVTVGDSFVLIPDWVKNITKYWVNNQMSDEQYTDTLTYLIEQKIVYVPHSIQTTDDANSEIPIWIKTNSQKWVDGTSSSDEFSIGIQWMLERGPIRV